MAEPLASELSSNAPLPARRGSIRIALVDDHHLVREGLRLVLSAEPGLEVVGQAATHTEAFELAASQAPDVLLLDLGFPEGDGMPLIRALLGRHPTLRIIVVTMDRSPESVRQAFVAGASGYVVKGARSSELVDAVRAVAHGERYAHSSVTGAIVDDAVRLAQSGQALSVREREIVSHLASGHSPAVVARMLGISVHTVRRHVANVSAKLGLSGRTALVRYAIKNGLAREA
jgi:DNA-binding NarL/FixJ family response regulator